MVAEYKAATDTFDAARPRIWAEVKFETRGGQSREYDLHSTSDRFAVPGLAQVGSERQHKAVFVFNFTDELRRVAPPR